jgi:hypothetical protein
MDQMNVSLGHQGSDDIALIAESELAKFDRASNRRFTDAHQQETHSGDLFFGFLKDIEGAKIQWGSSGSTTGGTPDLDTMPSRPRFETR